ncbi:hypothetical protein ACHAXA_002597 [Cyclostephanos tholiformis]|uniref:Uncharacterized protein n=1 Tax=Cyclostephanos tholiformis TaxID=382380 RepID=A0ABD3SBB9_9STRA
MTATTATRGPRLRLGALLLIAVGNIVIFLRSWTSSDDDGEELYDYHSASTRRLAHLPPPGREVIRAMRARGEGDARVSSEPYKRALELSYARAPMKLNRNDRHSVRVLNRRERKKLKLATEDFWLRWGVNVRGGDHDNHGNSAEAEDLNGLDDVGVRELLQDKEYEPMKVCGRATDVGKAEDLALQQRYGQCPEINPARPILILSGQDAFGRTGNNLVELIHAVQYARDHDIQLGIGVHSWAMDVIQSMWLSATSNDWGSELESALCVKIFYDKTELHAWEVRNNTIYIESRDLFHYDGGIKRPLREYMAGQEYFIRALFRHYNHGECVDHKGSPVRDMCSGIDALFGAKRKHAIYTVIHVRSLEGAPGRHLMNRLARYSGCDPIAALHMEPEYIKSILRPLGMMAYPIVVITDGQDPSVLERLLDDEEIGHVVRVVPPDASWYGGDMTAAIMGNVFIGNPASSYSSFIAKARVALGFRHNYLFRARDMNGEWRTVCGDICLFDQTVVGFMA